MQQDKGKKNYAFFYNKDTGVVVVGRIHINEKLSRLEFVRKINILPGLYSFAAYREYVVASEFTFSTLTPAYTFKLKDNLGIHFKGVHPIQTTFPIREFFSMGRTAIILFILRRHTEVGRKILLAEKNITTDNLGQSWPKRSGEILFNAHESIYFPSCFPWHVDCGK